MGSLCLGWQVGRNNERGQRFFERMGATPKTWSLNESDKESILPFIASGLRAGTTPGLYLQRPECRNTRTCLRLRGERWR